MREIYKKDCTACGKSGIPEDAEVCPDCGRSKHFTKVRYIECEIPNCGYVWLPRTKTLPAYCPRCHRSEYFLPAGRMNNQLRHPNDYTTQMVFNLSNSQKRLFKSTCRRLKTPMAVVLNNAIQTFVQQSYDGMSLYPVWKPTPDNIRRSGAIGCSTAQEIKLSEEEKDPILTALDLDASVIDDEMTHDELSKQIDADIDALFKG